MRALIHLAGPRGGGKTAVDEAPCGAAWAVRWPVYGAERDDSISASEEDTATTHGELRRHTAAGAGVVAPYRCPATHENHQALCLADAMGLDSAAVLIESDCPQPGVDLGVLVARRTQA